MIRKSALLAVLILFAAGAVLFTVSVTRADDDEVMVNWNSLNAQVHQAIETALHGQPDRVSRETEDGKTVYEAEKDGVEVEVGENGEVLEVDSEIASDQLPAEVRQAIEQHFSGAQIKEASRKQITLYEVELKSGGITREVAFYGNGQMLTQDDDDHHADGEDDDDGEEDDD